MVLRTGTEKNSSVCDPAASGICVWPQHLGSRGTGREKWGADCGSGLELWQKVNVSNLKLAGFSILGKPIIKSPKPQRVSRPPV